MNHFLLDRSTGTLGPHSFARLQSSQLLHAIQPAAGILFNGGEKEAVPAPVVDEDTTSEHGEVREKIWAHKAGVNALAVDIEGKLYSPLVQLFVCQY